MLSVKELGLKTIKVLQYILNYQDDNGLSPSQLEIAGKMKFAGNQVVIYHLQRLKEAGIIEMKKGMARGIIIPDRRKAVELLHSYGKSNIKSKAC